MRRDYSGGPNPKPQETPPLTGSKISPYACQRRTTLNNRNHIFTVTGLPKTQGRRGLQVLPVSLQVVNSSEKLGKFFPHSPTPLPTLISDFSFFHGLLESWKCTNLFGLYPLEMVGCYLLRVIIIGHHTCQRQIFGKSKYGD